MLFAHSFWPRIVKDLEIVPGNMSKSVLRRKISFKKREEAAINSSQEDSQQQEPEFDHHPQHHRLKKTQSVKRSASRRLQSATTCPLCIKEFNTPKLLPCDHTFCKDCLKPYVNPKNLVDCPVCKREHLVPQGDISNLPDSPDIVKLMRARHKHSHHGSPRSPDRRFGFGDGNCSVCQVAINKDKQSQFCMHCQKVYCSLCFSSHSKLLKSQLTEMTSLLHDSEAKVETIQKSLKAQFDDLAHTADSMEEEQIATIQARRKELTKSIGKMRQQDESDLDRIRGNIARLLSSVTSAPEEEHNDEDLVKHFMSVHTDYTRTMEHLERMSCMALEVDSTFQVHCKDKRQDLRKKRSVMVKNSSVQE